VTTGEGQSLLHHPSMFMRLFIAIEVPDALKQELAAAQRGLQVSGAEASWTRATAMHLTLKFLGEVPETNVSEISDALSDVVKTRAGFRINVAGIGAFPDQKNARVVWAGVAGDVEKLAMLQVAVDESMVALGFERDTRSFTPHLTLGRIRRIPSKDRWLKSLEAINGLELPAFQVGDIRLIKSELKPSGAEYLELGRFSLMQA
jgi:2'-5' RNA ligase